MIKYIFDYKYLEVVYDDRYIYVGTTRGDYCI